MVQDKDFQRVGLIKRKSLLGQTSLASVESLSTPLVQEVVLPADIQCAVCQKRVAEIMSRMNGTESVVINVLEKKITLTCKYPTDAEVPGSRKIAPIFTNPFSRSAMIKRIMRSFLCI